MNHKRGKNSMLTRTLCALVCVAALFSLAAAGAAEAVDFSTAVSLISENSLKITSHTEDFTLGTGEGEELRVSVRGIAPYTYVWQVSSDGGANWATAQDASNAPAYSISNAAVNPNKDSDGKDIPYQYKITVSNGNEESDSAIIKVLVSDEYAYRKISLRNGDTDVSSYMHDATRLVVTPVSDSAPAALTLEEALNDGCLPLLICDVKLVNRNNDVAPYFGTLRIDFHVGTQYDGQALNVYHLRGNTIDTYSEVVDGGVLSITVNSLSPFMVEVPDSSAFTVTANAGAGGSISPAGSVNVAGGSDKTFVFLPNAGYRIDRVLVDGSPVAVAGNSYIMTNITSDRSVFVSFSAVTASDTMHTLAVRGGTHGAVSPFGAVQVRHGSAQTVYFYPDAGYELAAVTVNGVEVSVIGNSYTVSAMTANTSITAAFRLAATQPPNVYRTITAAADSGGSISPSGSISVEYGGDMYFYLIPNSGYTVDKVYIDNVQTSVTNGCYHFINVTAPHTVRATFKVVSTAPQITYHTVTASSGAHGSVSPYGSVRVANGNSAWFTFIPDDGYELDTLVVDGRTIEAEGASYCFENVASDHTVRVTFKETPLVPNPDEYHTVTAAVAGNGSVSPSGDIRIPDGGSQTFYFMADEGYELDAVYVNGEKQNAAGGQFTVDGVNGDVELSVTFKQISGIPPEAECHCLWANVFGRCGICGIAGRCVAPCCWLVPLLTVLALGYAAWAIYRKREKR